MERVSLIRERERQREELEASNARLRLLDAAVQAMRESVLITDAGMDSQGPRIVFVNPAFTAKTGYTEEEALGKTPKILQGPKTDRAVLDRLRTNLAEHQPFSGVAINYKKDGSEFILD
jgi:PAS domain S-box-containing protein